MVVSCSCLSPRILSWGTALTMSYLHISSRISNLGSWMYLNIPYTSFVLCCFQLRLASCLPCRTPRLWGLPRFLKEWPATLRCSWPAAWAWPPCTWSSWLRALLDHLHHRHPARCQVLSCQEHPTWRTTAWPRLLCASEAAWCLALCCWPLDSPPLLMWKMWWSPCLCRV